MGASRRASVSLASLQWGHERALVEIAAGARTRCRRPSFNGATSARSWKYPQPGRAGVRQLRFNGATSARSWKLRQRAGYAGAGHASMGPRARARGNTGYLRGPYSVPALQWGHERALVEM